MSAASAQPDIARKLDFQHGTPVRHSTRKLDFQHGTPVRHSTRKLGTPVHQSATRQAAAAAAAVQRAKESASEVDEFQLIKEGSIARAMQCAARCDRFLAKAELWNLSLIHI